MNVASLELCKELYELSGWFDTYAKHYLMDGFRSIRPGIHAGDKYPGHQLILEAPAYDLGYLLRKLPAKHKFQGYLFELTLRKEDNLAPDGIRYLCFYGDDTERYLWAQQSTIPEDTACQFAIELFKQGILKKESTK